MAIFVIELEPAGVLLNTCRRTVRTLIPRFHSALSPMTILSDILPADWFTVFRTVKRFGYRKTIAIVSAMERIFLPRSPFSCPIDLSPAGRPRDKSAQRQSVFALFSLHVQIISLLKRMASRRRYEHSEWSTFKSSAKRSSFSRPSPLL